MKLSIPSIPEQSNRVVIEYTVQNAAEMVAYFLSRSNGRGLIMTGAGASVDSGIAPYRGENGHYTVHKTYRPIFYHEFTDESPKGYLARQRYFSRSYLGFPPVRTALPNRTHYSIAAIQRLGYVPKFITQNVDNLHHAATPSQSVAAETILELHGTLKHVVCVSSPQSFDRSKAPLDKELYDALSSSSLLSGPRSATPRAENTPVGSNYPKGCGFRGSRAVFQEELTRLNPPWAQLAEHMAATGSSPKTNPDGDVDLGSADYSSFRYPSCPNCGGILKPAVIFFGESVPNTLGDHSYQLVKEAESFLLVGTSLATYSAFRLVKQAVEDGKRVMIINQGPTRADGIVEDKVELGCSDVLNQAARVLANGREEKDHVLNRLLESGVTIKPMDRRGVVSS